MAINYKFDKNVGATGQLGAPDMQAKFGTQFIPTGRFSVQGNREFDTFANAESYVYTNASAFPGIIVTVSEDTDSAKNGAYLVELDTISDANPNGLKLTKLAAGGYVDEKLEWTEITDDETEVPAE